jgi:hypothetical protein
MTRRFPPPWQAELIPGGFKFTNGGQPRVKLRG